MDRVVCCLPLHAFGSSLNKRVNETVSQYSLFFFFLMFSYFNKVKDLLKLFFSHQRACYVISFVPKLLLIFRLCLQKNLLPFRSYIKLLFLVNYCDGGEVNFIYLFSPLCYTFQHTSL